MSLDSFITTVVLIFIICILCKGIYIGVRKLRDFIASCVGGYEEQVVYDERTGEPIGREYVLSKPSKDLAELILMGIVVGGMSLIGLYLFS